MTVPNMLLLPIIPSIYPNTAALPVNVSTGSLAVVNSPSPPTIYVYNGSGWVIANTTGGGLVIGITGTANQILANGTSGTSVDGSVTLTLPSSVIMPGDLSVTNLTASQTVVTDGSKKLVSIAYTNLATASTFVYRDSNGNTRANNFGSNATAVTSASGTTILTAASSRYQVLQGSQSQNFNLPDATTLFVGARFEFNNNSTGSLTVNNNSGSLVTIVPSGGSAILICIASVTANGAWDVHFEMPANASYGTAGLVITGTLTVSSLTSGSVLFAGSSGLVTQDNTNFTWDNTNKILSVGNKIAITASSLNASQLTLSGTMTKDQIGLQLGISITTTFTTVTLTSAIVRALSVTPTYNLAQASQSTMVGIYTSPTWSGAGSLDAYYGIWSTSSLASGANITWAYGIAADLPADGTNKVAGSFRGAVQIGGSYSTNLPPTNGLLVQGASVFGATSATASTQLTMQAGTNAYFINLTGTNTGVTSGLLDQGAIKIDNNFTGNNTVTNIKVINMAPTYTLASGASLTAIYGVYVSPGIAGSGNVSYVYGYYITAGSGSAGTITWSIGLQVDQPSFGTNRKCVCVNGNMTVGTSYVTVVPPLNGAMIQGNVSIGLSSNTNALDVFGGVAIGSSAGSVSVASGSLITSGTVAVGNSTTGAAQLLVNGASSKTEGIYLTGTLQTTGTVFGSTDIIGYYSSITLQPSGTAGAAYAMGINPLVNASLATSTTINNSIGLYISSGTLSSGTVNTAYTAFFTRPSFGTTKITLYTDDLNVGYSSASPPPGGAIISSKTSIGTSSPSSAFFTVSPPSGVNSYVWGYEMTGTIQGAAGLISTQDTIGFAIYTTIKPNGVAATYAVMQQIYPTIDASLATSTTIANAVGLYVDSGGLLSGTVTSAYGIIAKAPAFGTTRTAIYADNLSVGYTAVNTPSNGAVISGQLFIGASSTNSSNSKLQVTQTGNGFSQTDGTGIVVTYASSNTYGLGTFTNHYLSFFTNNSGPLVQIAPGGGLVVGSSYTFNVPPDANGAIIQGTVGIGTVSPNNTSCMLHVVSTTKGVCFPNMTTTQKNAIANVAGNVVFDTTLGKLCVNNGSAWQTITSV